MASHRHVDEVHQMRAHNNAVSAIVWAGAKRLLAAPDARGASSGALHDVTLLLQVRGSQTACGP